MYRGPKLMKWSMCIMPRSSLPTPATLERATLNMYARTTATFFSMQHSSRQSYAMCHCVNSVLSYSRKTTFDMADVRRLEFRWNDCNLHFCEPNFIKIRHLFINDIERFSDLQHGGGRPPSWIFKSFNFWSYDCHHVQYLLNFTGQFLPRDAYA